MAEIRFYRAAGRYDFLSNLFRRPVVMQDHWVATSIAGDMRAFRSAEDAYQYPKPRDRGVAEWLLQAPSPYLVAFTAHALPSWAIRPDWATFKVLRMRDVLEAKFRQHADLRAQLLDTGDAQLIEESKTDAFWGIGAKGKGQNRLGVMLMELRAALRPVVT